MQELIYNQHDIPRKVLRYGLRSSAATGCGWIAAYNAMTILGCRVSPQELIRRFERSMPLINGAFGTFLPDLVLFFRRQGFSPRLCAIPARFDEAAKSAPVCVMFYFWRAKRSAGAHFVTLRWLGGRFEGYNTYRNSSGPDNYGPSLEAYMKKQRWFLPLLICLEAPADETRPGSHDV